MMEVSFLVYDFQYGTEKRVKQTELKKLSQIFHRWLFVCVAIAFLATGAFTYMLQTQIAVSDTEQLLTLNLEDVKMEIHDTSVFKKYAGVRLPFGGFLQVAYNSERFQKDIDEEVVYAANNRHIEQNGSVIICDESFRIVSDQAGYIGNILDLNNIKDDLSALKPFETFEAMVRGTLSYCAFTSAEGYYILAVLSQSEAMASRNISVCVLVCMEILVFAALFVYIYFLIKRLILSDLQKITYSLTKITEGDLDETVEVRTNAEFALLSDDINATVTTLKRYINEAEKRIDQELEYARQIQYSTLPSVFPPYPNRNRI